MEIRDKRIDWSAVPVRLVAVARANASASGSYLSRATFFFSCAVKRHVEVEQDVSTVRNEDAALVIYSRRSKALELAEEAR